MRKPKRASAQPFVVVSHLPCVNVYTGTREQLIALGFASPEQFPEGRKRLKFDYSAFMESGLGWQMRKLKGAIFRLKEERRDRGRGSWNERSKGEPVFFHVGMKKNEAGYIPWTIIADDTGGELSSGYSYRSLEEAANLIFETVKYEQYQAKRSRLKLITATGGK